MNAAAMIERLRNIAQERSVSYPDDNFLLRGLWTVNYRYRPNRWERDLSYSMIYAQTIWQGCCYVDYGSASIDEDLLYQDARLLRPDDHGTAVAILDSIYAIFDKSPDETFTFQGSADDKAVKRAQIVVDQVEALVDGKREARILNVGVMGNFIKQLKDKGMTVVGSDFDQGLVESGINDAKVESGTRTLELIKDYDVVLATGMTLWTKTLGEIIDTVRANGKKLVLFAATGSHFGEEYCRSFGVDLVISEPQPQYMFQGTSVIYVFRKKPTTDATTPALEESAAD